MKKIITLTLAIFLLSFCALAQDDKTESRPDFSGTWIFDEKRSSVENEGFYKNYTLIISHAEPEIKITRTAIFMGKNKSKDLILYTDKRGETNFPFFSEENPKVKSKTYWKKNTLVSEYRQNDSPFATGVGTGGSDKYSLSEDKKTLIIISIVRLPLALGDRFNKWVFRKKE